MLEISEIDSDLFSLDAFPEIGKGLPEQFNYIVEIQKLVAQVFTELGRIATNSHSAVEDMKQKYLIGTVKVADLMTAQGRLGRNVALITFTVFCLRLGLQNPDDREITNVISQQMPHFCEMLTSGKSSQLETTRAQVMLELEKYKDKTASKQSDGNAKQDYLSLLQAFAELLKSASRAG